MLIYRQDKERIKGIAREDKAMLKIEVRDYDIEAETYKEI